MLNLEVKENGILTADGKGILPGSLLVVKGEMIPAAWAGLVEVGERKLVFATPGKSEAEIKAEIDAEVTRQVDEKVTQYVAEHAAAEEAKLQAEIDAEQELADKKKGSK